MKIFMYSDLHISRTSSILPVSNDTKYTFRQQMIINTGKYMCDIIKNENPDIIINLGDTFDQHTITSYDVDVASEFFNCFKGLNKPHLVLVGNHEMINYNYNAVKILDNIENITVITEPCTIDCKLLPRIDGINYTAQKLSSFPKIAMIPYTETSDITEFPEGDFLFSHIDIQGSCIRGGFELPEGIEPSVLRDKYKLVFNGHIHKPSIKNNVINVGSISTHSFSDDEDSVPQCYIFDTDTLDLKTFKPNLCPLFRKYNIESNLSELQSFVDSLNTNYKYILHITCPFEIKDEVKQYLSNADVVVNSRITTKVKKDIQEDQTINTNIQSNVDVKQSFLQFLDTVDELKTPKEIYADVLHSL